MSPGAEPGFDDSFEDLYEHAPCGYLSTTLDGAIVRVNATFLSWTGYRRADLIGRPFVSCFRPGSQLLFETRYRSVLHLSGQANEVALSLRTADGGSLPILINGVVVADEDRGPRAVRVAVFEARQRQEYERELLAARRLAESSEARVRILQSASSTFAAAASETAVADRLADGAQEAFAASQASVYLLDDEGSLRLASGRPLLELMGRTEGPDEALVEAPRPIVVHREDAAASSAGSASAMRSARTETLATVALAEGPTRFGLLICSFQRARAFDGNDLELLEALALQASHVLTRIRLQRQLEHLALYDQLTGLASRPLVHRMLAEALGSTEPRGGALALIFVDLDGFKAINDELGHSAGDRALREIGGRLSAAVRQDDVVGRLGGDEFIVICTVVDREAAGRVVERLHAALREPLSGRAGAVRVTCSIGVALYSGGGSAPDPEVLIEQADAAMYRSKRAGKNRTTTVEVREGSNGDS